MNESKKLPMLLDLIDEDATELFTPEEMQRNLNRLDERDRLYNKISNEMKNKNANLTEKLANKEFLERYANKMEAPKGLSPQSITDETARLGMKLPQTASKLGRAAAKIGKVGSGLALGLLGELAFGEEANPAGNIIEDPSVPLDQRGFEAMMQGAAAEKEMQKEAKRAAFDKMMEDLRQKKLKRTEMLMKKYGQQE